MARSAATGFWSLIRKSARSVRRCTERFQAKWVPVRTKKTCQNRKRERGSDSVGTGKALGAQAWLAAFLILFASAPPVLCQTDALKGEATLSTTDGYARLLLTMADDVDVDVSTAGTILVISFKRPVDIPVDDLADAAPDYVSSARRDPDGMAIRLSLSRKVTVNTMSAGEKIFIDLLPDTWAGPPPSLPPEVIRELAERARAAERALRAQRAADAAKKRPPVRVRALMQPTFVRFVFEMPDGVNVSSMLTDQKLTLAFNAVLNFDLADAKVAAPPNVASITQKSGQLVVGGDFADRRRRRALVPRRQEFHCRRCIAIRPEVWGRGGCHPCCDTGRCQGGGSRRGCTAGAGFTGCVSKAGGKHFIAADRPGRASDHGKVCQGGGHRDQAERSATSSSLASAADRRDGSCRWNVAVNGEGQCCFCFRCISGTGDFGRQNAFADSAGGSETCIRRVCTRAAAAARRRNAGGERLPRQRRAACEIWLRHRDASGLVPSRRHGVAGI